MDRIPTEILENILSRLTSRDLKRQRLVCRGFETVASQALFSHLNIWIQPNSFERLLSVATSPRLSHCVKKISIGNAFFVEYPMCRQYFINWFNNIVDPGGSSLTHRNHRARVFGFLDFCGFDSSRAHTAYETYKTLIDQQNEFMKSDRPSRWFSEAVNNLINLREVEFVKNRKQDFISSEADIGFFCAIARNIGMGDSRLPKYRRGYPKFFQSCYDLSQSRLLTPAPISFSWPEPSFTKTSLDWDLSSVDWNFDWTWE